MVELAFTANRIHASVDWPTVLEGLGIPPAAVAINTNKRRSKNSACPACGGVDRFFFDNKRGHGDYFCNQCGAGDGFTLLMRTFGWDFSTARRRVMESAGLDTDFGRPANPSCPPYEPARAIARDQPAALQDWSTTAERIWRATNPLRGSLGETYLRARGCAMPPLDSHLRFLPASDGHPPSLCAAITDTITAKPISLHFTKLSMDGTNKAGTDRDRHLLKGHRKAGGCIRLWPDEGVTLGLGIAEGLETALTAAHAFAPVSATVDAGNLSTFPVLPGIEVLTVIADNDEAGLKAAVSVAKRWKDAGREVRILVPPKQGEDLNDMAVSK